MKPLEIYCNPVPKALCNFGIAALNPSELCVVGLTIKKPRDYDRAIKKLPSGRALRRLMAKRNKGAANAR